MTSRLIAPSKTFGYTDIYLDFLAGSDPARNFYQAPTAASVAEKLDMIAFDRELLVGLLHQQNQRYGASLGTHEGIDKLRDPRAVCVFAGQQAGLLGGPMYTLIKALATVRAAAAYTQELQRPVVPVFWIAGDDHDFEEANHAWVLNRQGQLVQLAYQSAPEVQLPTAEIRFTDAGELNRVMAALRECLGETDFTPGLYELVASAYTPDDTFVTAFGKFMAALTKDLGLVLFCPGDPAVKRHAVPFFKAIVEKQDELRRAITERNHLIEQSGYHIQVEKKDNASHLFYNEGGRTPVLHDGDSFVVGDGRMARTELLALIEEYPERFSPDVMTRPVFQSFLLPTVSQKGGPAELAYLAQINPIFELFDLPAPYYLARPTITLLEARYERLMREHDITFEELAGDIELVINRVLAGTFPPNLQALLEHLRRHVQTHFEDISRGSLTFDPALGNFARQTYGKIDFTLKTFEAKVFSSHKKKSQETRDRIYRLWHAAYPNHRFQERTLNVSYFVSRYGLDIVSFIYEKMDCEEKAHQVLYLSELTQ